MNRTRAKLSSLVELLRLRAFQQPEQRIYTYLIDGETEGPHLTYEALDRQARAIAALLQSYQASGSEHYCSILQVSNSSRRFFGCLYAGVIAVPLPPPNMAQPQRALCTVSRNRKRCSADSGTDYFVDPRQDRGVCYASPGLRTCVGLRPTRWRKRAADEWRDPRRDVDTLALIQYTSGSTAIPKGVMVSHGNLLENSAHIAEAFEISPDDISVTWLPVFHDMGLTNGIIQPMYGGRDCILMPPQSFLQRPVRWLQAISKYKATISGGPILPTKCALARSLRSSAMVSTLAVGSWRTMAPSRSVPTPSSGLLRPLLLAVSAQTFSIRVTDSPRPR